MVGPSWALMVSSEGNEAETKQTNGHHEVFSDMLVHKQMGNEEGLPGHKVISDVLRSVIHPPGVFHDDRKRNFGHILAGIVL